MTQKSVIPLVLALLLACAGCAAGRMGATPAEMTPAAVPKSTPQPSPKTKPPAPTPAPPVTGTGSQNQPGAPVAAAPDAPLDTTKAPPPAGEAPPATASTYVYSPQQAAVTPPAPSQPPSPQGDLPPAPSSSGAVDTEPPRGKETSPGLPGGELQLLVVASAAQVAVGEVMTVDVMASSSTAVVDAPLHLTFDPNVVEFVDGVPGDFLTQGGSSVVFLADGRGRPGDVAIAAGRVTREQGASGSGLLCRVRLRGVGAGASPIRVAQAKAWDTAGEPLTVRSTGTAVTVR